MKYINNSYIKKSYEEDYENITLHLEDTRDNYIEEEALGNIGTINISRVFFQVLPEDDFENLEVKEEILEEAVKEIFGTTEIDETSDIYYEKIKGMITDGTLETFGYTAMIKEEDLDDSLENYNQKQGRRR